MRSYTISFHNHLPAPKNSWYEAAAIQIGRRLLRSSFMHGVDILCLNQWATAPRPFFFYEALSRKALSSPYEVEDNQGYMTIWHGGQRLLLVKGLEIGVLTETAVVGEVILLGVDSDFRIEVGELPGLVASPKQKRQLWYQVCHCVQSRHCWLAIVPHPCYEGSLGLQVTQDLVESGRLDTFERHNSMLALVDPAANRSTRALEDRIAARRGQSFSGVTGNDGVDSLAPLLSLTEVALEIEPAGTKHLLSELATKVRQGQVTTHCRSARLSNAAWKFLESQRKWSHIQRHLLRVRARPGPPKP